MDYRAKFKKRKIVKVKNNADFSKAIESQSKITKFSKLAKFIIFFIFSLSIVVLILASNVFQIKSISVIGNEILNSTEVTEYLNSEYLGSNIWIVFSSSIHAKLNAKYGIIDSVIIDKKLPDRLTVQIFEKNPEINLNCVTNTIFDKYGEIIQDFHPEVFPQSQSQLINIECGDNIGIDNFNNSQAAIFNLIHLIDDNLYIDRANDKLVLLPFNTVEWRTPNYIVVFNITEDISRQIVRFKMVRDQIIKEGNKFSYMDVSSYKVIVKD